MSKPLHEVTAYKTFMSLQANNNFYFNHQNGFERADSKVTEIIQRYTAMYATVYSFIPSNKRVLNSEETIKRHKEMSAASILTVFILAIKAKKIIKNFTEVFTLSCEASHASDGKFKMGSRYMIEFENTKETLISLIRRNINTIFKFLDSNFEADDIKGTPLCFPYYKNEISFKNTHFNLTLGYMIADKFAEKFKNNIIFFGTYHSMNNIPTPLFENLPKNIRQLYIGALPRITQGEWTYCDYMIDTVFGIDLNANTLYFKQNSEEVFSLFSVYSPENILALVTNKSFSDFYIPINLIIEPFYTSTQLELIKEELIKTSNNFSSFVKNKYEIPLFPSGAIDIIQYSLEEAFILKEENKIKEHILLTRSLNLFSVYRKKLIEKEIDQNIKLIYALQRSLAKALEFHNNRTEKLISYSSDPEKNAEILSNQIKNIRKHPKVQAVKIVKKGIIITTTEIFIPLKIKRKVFQIGRFEIEIVLNGRLGGVNYRNLDRQIDAYSIQMHAPHIFNNGVPCYGNVMQSFGQLAEQFRYDELAGLAIHYISSVNLTDAAGKYIVKWPSMKYLEYKRICKKRGEIPTKY